MSWTHRVLRSVNWSYDEKGKRHRRGYTFGIHEVFYEDNKQVYGITDPVEPHGTTLEELRRDLERMLKALDKPVIDNEKYTKQLNARRAKKGLPPWRDSRKPTEKQLAQAAREMGKLGKPKKGKVDGSSITSSKVR